MKRYKNRKSDIVVKVINQSEEENKINVEFVNGKKAGQQVSYKLASFTKSWFVTARPRQTRAARVVNQTFFS